MATQQHPDSSGRIDSPVARASADALVSRPVVNAKAEADLLIVCAEIGFDVGKLTQFERFMWLQAFRRGAVYGLEIAKTEIRGIRAA